MKTEFFNSKIVEQIRKSKGLDIYIPIKMSSYLVFMVPYLTFLWTNCKLYNWDHYN